MYNSLAPQPVPTQVQEAVKMLCRATPNESLANLTRTYQSISGRVTTANHGGKLEIDALLGEFMGKLGSLGHAVYAAVFSECWCDCHDEDLNSTCKCCEEGLCFEEAFALNSKEAVAYVAVRETDPRIRVELAAYGASR